jgi:hypothetical protein
LRGLPQQELAQAMFRTQFVDFGICSGPDQISQCLMLLVGYPDGCEITTAQQTRQLQGVTAISLHLIARPHRNERRCGNQALDAELRQLAVQCIPGRPSLIRDSQLHGLAAQLHHQLADR